MQARIVFRSVQANSVLNLFMLGELLGKGCWAVGIDQGDLRRKHLRKDHPHGHIYADNADYGGIESSNELQSRRGLLHEAPPLRQATDRHATSFQRLLQIQGRITIDSD